MSLKVGVWDLKTRPFPVCSLFFVFVVKDVSSHFAAPAALLAACCHTIRTIVAANPLELYICLSFFFPKLALLPHFTAATENSPCAGPG